MKQQNIEFSEDLFDSLHAEAKLQKRTIAEQVVHWMSIGRAVEKSNDFDFARVTEAINGRLETTELSGTEDAVWKAFFAERMADGVVEEDDYYMKAGRCEKNR